MRLQSIHFLAIMLCFVLLAPAVLFAADEPGFKPLFDGKTLNGWEGDPRLWKVENGEIVGSTDGIVIDKNTFLIYKGAEFGNFILRADVKLRNHNSGIQFRSEALPEYVVQGYQADMAEGNWWGGVYEEKGKRGVMVNGWKGKAEHVVKDKDWNEVEIRCQGPHIQILINGLLTAELTDDLKLSGVIAFQLHRGPGMEARFRNIRILTRD
ncbi:MAG: DUF1080 domain-containing protein [Bryobacterales bacterium]|nr:DUF1080 domain-containing protein [Bryobacterales bacterium]